MKLISTRKFNRYCKRRIGELFTFVNFFYEPWLFKKLKKEILKLSKGTQLFLMNRLDFGTILQQLNYIRDWQEQIGQTAVVVLNSHQKAVAEMAQLLTPQTEVIGCSSTWYRIFGKHPVYQKCYRKVFAQLLWDFPASRYLYFDNHETYDNFPANDQGLFSIACPESTQSCFAKKFDQVKHDCHKSCYWSEYIKLYYSGVQRKRAKPSREILTQLGIVSPYILLNLPKTPFHDRHFKRIGRPEKYNVVIDFLIEKGFQVVLQGRGEQFHFAPRARLINYAHSDQCSAVADLQLFAHATGAIISKTGPQIFAQLFALPHLDLDSCEPHSMTFNPKGRFFPQRISCKRRKRYLSWQEVLQEEVFFQVSGRVENNPYIYHELEEEELLMGLVEFLELIENDSWKQLTPRQKEYRNALHPAHGDLYHSHTLPCDSYLEISSTNSPLVVESASRTSEAVPL